MSYTATSAAFRSSLAYKDYPTVGGTLATISSFINQTASGIFAKVGTFFSASKATVPQNEARFTVMELYLNSRTKEERRVPLFMETKETQPIDSISKYAFEKIILWRSEDKGSVSRKIVAEIGYVSVPIIGAAELPLRLVYSYIVGNDLVVFAAETLFTEEHLEKYLEFRGCCVNGVKETSVAMVQGTTSLGTNMISQSANVALADKIQSSLERPINTIINVIQAISPVSIGYAVFTRNPQGLVGIVHDIGNHVTKDNRIQYQYPDPRPTTRLKRLFLSTLETYQMT